MNIVTRVNEWRELRNSFSHQPLGFVPTMGNIHSGHISLCERARSENDIALVSIFINPMQFNQPIDFETYPRTLAEDLAILANVGVDYVFLPEINEIYPDDCKIKLIETELSHQVEGECRPGHFDGMLTVVLKLFNIIQPNKVYFGEKDYQQLMLVKKMVSTLFLPIEIIGCETVRAADGLALSSRNTRLNDEQRIKAAFFPKLLHSSLPVAEVIKQLKALDFKVEYVVEKWQRRLAAVWLDNVRLIDNIPIK